MSRRNTLLLHFLNVVTGSLVVQSTTHPMPVILFLVFGTQRMRYLIKNFWTSSVKMQKLAELKILTVSSDEQMQWENFARKMKN